MGSSLLGEFAAFVLASASAHQPHAVPAATAGLSAPALHRMLLTHPCLYAVDTIAQLLASDSQLGLGTQHCCMPNQHAHSVSDASHMRYLKTSCQLWLPNACMQPCHELSHKWARKPETTAGLQAWHVGNASCRSHQACTHLLSMRVLSMSEICLVPDLVHRGT